MKIAVIASTDGEKALYLHDFFKEGNRIDVDCLLTDNPESPVARRMREEGIDVIFMTPGQQMAELSSLLKTRGIELLVVDDYNGELPSEIKDTFGEAIVYPSRKEKAPLEVIETTDRLKAAANAAMQTQPHQTEEGEKNKDADTAEDELSLEQEWADVLNVDVDSKAPENPSELPPTYTDTPPNNGPQVDYRQPYGNYQPNGQPYFGQPFGPQPYSQNPYGNAHLPEPMPNNYLIWSVLLTVFCCLIPGIVAIIYSASVGSKYYSGDLEGAKRASRYAQIWCIVSVVAGVIWATLYIPLAIFLS